MGPVSFLDMVSNASPIQCQLVPRTSLEILEREAMLLRIYRGGSFTPMDSLRRLLCAIPMVLLRLLPGISEILEELCWWTCLCQMLVEQRLMKLQGNQLQPLLRSRRSTGLVECQGLREGHRGKEYLFCKSVFAFVLHIVPSGLHVYCHQIHQI